jgi:hypothetical protein
MSLYIHPQPLLMHLRAPTPSILWATLLCVGLVQFLQLAAKEHKNGYHNDVDDDNTGATVTIDVTIAIDNDAATATIEDDESNHL